MEVCVMYALLLQKLAVYGYPSKFVEIWVDICPTTDFLEIITFS